MSGRLRVSIAMAVYNGERFIREQLDSYLKQTRLPDELVVSDNASTDRTREIVQDFAVRAPFEVRLYVNERNLGMDKNFERAISLCTGDIIFLSDCDDVWMPQKLERMVAVFETHPSVGLVCANSALVDEQLRPLGRNIWTRKPKAALLPKGAETARASLAACPSGHGHSLALRANLRELFLPFQPPAFDAHYDSWIYLRLALAADVYAIDEPLVLYRIHPGQDTDLRGMGSRRLSLTGRIRLMLSLMLSPYPMPPPHHRFSRFLNETVPVFGQIDPKAGALIGSAGRFYSFREDRILELPYMRGLGVLLTHFCRGDYHRFCHRWLRALLRDLIVVHNFKARKAAAAFALKSASQY